MTPSQKALGAIGWRVVHTNPAFQSFHFERWVGRRRVAAVILTAKTTAKAWGALRKMLRENAEEDAA